ncbi:hypothetical protein [Yellowstone lake mimivirus]|uniref:hypothetical protein n=1 Tax=Yellowstone lake mimivirus TaxID=1586712 RepID=UPI0006EBC1C6|nr:hypothetical protein AR680_gp085 [Yellowstone lake mimivirus]BAT22009.1 hypothetical protein [Yellowstone lake mimivirus]
MRNKVLYFISSIINNNPFYSFLEYVWLSMHLIIYGINGRRLNVGVHILTNGCLFDIM